MVHGLPLQFSEPLGKERSLSIAPDGSGLAKAPVHTIILCPYDVFYYAFFIVK